MAIDMIEQNELGALAPSRVGNDRCFVDEKSKIEDIFNSEYLYVWKDEHSIFITFYLNGLTLSFPKEHWPGIKDEFSTLSEL